VNILQIYPKADFFTGAAIQLRDLAEAQWAANDFRLLTTRPSAHWDVACHRGRMQHAAVPMRSSLDLRSAWALARLIREHRIDVVHCQKGRARSLALLAGLTVRIPALILNRGVSFPLTRWNRFGYTSGRVNAIVAVCAAIKRDLVASGVAAEKIDVIYSGTDLERFHPGVDGSAIRREIGLGPQHFVVTQVGVRSWRGWQDVLDAMARIAPQIEHARLLFIGAPAPRIAEVLDRARERSLGGRVIVLGHRTDVPEILAASDVVVDASWAGLGITGSLREALACGRPVIGTNLAGMPELIEDGRTGLLVPPREPDALAQAIAKLAGDPAWRREIGQAGRALVESRYSLEAKLDATVALYRRLAS